MENKTACKIVNYTHIVKEDRGFTERTKKLRRRSIEAEETISSERARLLTAFYKDSIEESIPIKRAKAFEYILLNKEIYIGEDELIVGERGEKPKATPTYPEITLHSLEDLSVLNDREKVSYSVSDDVFQIYEKEIIPFWQGRTIRDMIFREVSDEWKNAFEAGVFTEFMEQRAPGHTVLDGKIYKKGMKDFIDDIDKALSNLDYENDSEALDKKEELEAMKIAANAIIKFAQRYADKAEELSKSAENEQRKDELIKIADICRWVPMNAPRTFHEALQYYWFVHLGVITELNGWDSFSPGKLDKHLYPFYEHDIKEGNLTKQEARELLECFWIKFHNHPAPPKIGVTAQESSTYTDFAQINIGGVREDGSDNVNELSYMLLDIVDELRIVQPNASIHVSKKTPDRFIKRAIEILKTSFGQPSIFNSDAVVQELLRQGKDIVDARCGGTSGCVETGAFGKENYTLTGYFNIPKVLEITINGGVDPLTSKQIGLKTPAFEKFDTFDEFLEAFIAQLHHFIDIKIEGNRIIERIYAKNMPAAFLSILIDDCIKTGKDYYNGGARYNSSYIQGVGTGTISDSLAAIKQTVFEDKLFTKEKFRQMLLNNFNGFEKERSVLLNKTHKYGNDDDYVDNLMRYVFNEFFSYVDGRETYRGGQFRINMLPTTVHVYFGSILGATPDGRLAHEPISEGISPVQGADKKGPTAVIKSASKMDHIKTGGTLLNQKFTPDLLKDKKGIDAVCKLVRAYFTLDGHHIQFNVVDAQTLRDAQMHPENYGDLIVRVAGYSDYFCHLNEQLQNEIIKRTEHEAI